MKPNDTPLYFHSQSNHPPTILKNIPLSVNKRLNSISANETVFNAATPAYQDALNKSGYNFSLKFDPQRREKKNNNRSRKVTWFNPPFSANVSTNIGAKFLRLVDSCFPPNLLLSKIFNRNTVKVSYKCMPNIKQAISRHNARVKKQENEHLQPAGPGCNCQNKDECPLPGRCLTKCLVYKVSVNTENTNETYTGLTGDTFKQRHYGHTSNFRHREQQDKTSLSTHIWKLKDENVEFDIDWSILDRAPAFNPVTGTCRLCLKEKYHIMFTPEASTLNKRSEIFATCRHRLKLLLNNT